MFAVFTVELIAFLVLFSPHYTGAFIQGIISFFSKKRSYLMIPTVFGSLWAGVVTIGIQVFIQKVGINDFGAKQVWKFFCLYWVSLYVVLFLAHMIGKAGQKKFDRCIEEKARARLV